MDQTKFRPTDKTALVTHRGCLDGTGSALVFIWAGGSPANILFRNPFGCTLTAEEAAPYDQVWFADVCPPSLEDPAGGKPFHVFDHHLSNAIKFEGAPSTTFSMEHSGTSLMARELGWNQYPELVSALEAYDLGRFDDVNGQFLADLAATFEQDDMLWLLQKFGPALFDDVEMRARAAGIAAARRIYAERAAAQAQLVPIFSPSDGTEVLAGVAVSPVEWKNSVAQAILRGEYHWGADDAEAHVAIVIDIVGQMASLRSLDGGPDCSRIASAYGGGGHARAAGFKINSAMVLRAVFNEVFE